MHSMAENGVEVGVLDVLDVLDTDAAAASVPVIT